MARSAHCAPGSRSAFLSQDSLPSLGIQVGPDSSALKDGQAAPSSRFGFFLVVLYLAFEYGRPQDLVPLIGALRPTLIIVPLMIFTWSKSGGLRKAKSPQLTLMILMFGLLAVHIPFAVNHYFAYVETEGFLLDLCVCVSIILFVDTQERVLTLMGLWALLAFNIAIRTILGHGYAGSAFLDDPNDVSLLLNTILPFILCMLVYERRPRYRFIYLAIALTCLGAIVSSTSRGGFVGLVAMVAVIWWISPRKFLTLVLLCIVGIATYMLAPQKYLDRIASIRSTDVHTTVISEDRDEGTAEGRLNSWRAAWAMFEDNPLGVGPGNFVVRFPEYQGQLFGGHGMWGREAHSLWFTLLAELGIPGAFLYALIFRANWRSLRHLMKLPTIEGQNRLASVLSVGFLAGLAGFFASGTFVSVLFYPHYWYLTAMIVATEKTLSPRVPRPTGSAASDPRRRIDSAGALGAAGESNR
jgi:putative inorganic carbon (hco3(-)) transporter